MSGRTAFLAVLAAVAALYLAYDHGVSVSEARWQAKWAKQQALQATGLATATTIERSEEQRRQTAINQVAKDAREQQISAIDEAAGADAAGQRLHEAAAKLASGTQCNAGDTGTAERSASATRAAMVLSDLLSRADKAAGQLAAAYDKARIAGLACERAYESVRH